MEEVLAEVGIQGADFSQSIEHPIPETSALIQGPRLIEEAVLPFEDLEVVRRAAGTPESDDMHVLCPPSVSGSGDGSPASDPIMSAAEKQLDPEISGDCIMEAEGDPVVLDMVAAKDAEGMTTASGDVISIAVEDTTAGVDSGGCGPVKRKRGRPRKNPEAPAALPTKKKEHEDICFVCFDRTNQNLVFCNRRGCYKAYHPVCVGRDEDFFRSKGKWNCGWHICSSCQKAAHYMCYTCTTSYCKVCITGESKYVSVRGTHGFCQSCHNTVTLIELNKLACEKQDGLNFVDTDSFTYLFKAYWLDLKGKLSMTSEELNNARHPIFVAQSESSDELYDANADQGFSSETSLSDNEGNIASKKKKGKRNSQAFSADKNFSKEIDVIQATMPQDTGWASKELLELVAHMRNGDQSFISQFDVQALLLEYIKKYNLRDPRRKSQIVCDLRLQNLFGKQRVGHFEMLKLLESHFLATEAVQGGAEGIPVETLYPDYKLSDDGEDGDMLARVGSQKKRKNRKKAEREMQNNVDDYAAIDVHNINLIFLRRSLVEELLDDIKTFNDKVVGSFVRIKISNAGQRQDLYRLVQVVGTHESSKPYKVGKKTTDIMLEILNLDKKETSSIDSISNQEFTEEECQRLRQSIKCGLINRLKVGYIQEKAMVLHTVRVNDSLESEKLRLNHLRDRASETGRRKELRECVEKLQLLNSPEERRRRLTEVPEIHADPKMDPEYQSSEGEDDKGQDYNLRAKEDAHRRKDRELILRGRLGNNWSSMHKSPNSQWESGRRMQSEVRKDRFDMYDTLAERSNEFPQNQSQEVPKMQIGSTESLSPRSLGQLNITTPEINLPALGGSFPYVPDEVEKIWHYQDPSKNIQGPFSLAQLRKWNATGYFPPDLRIWRTSQKIEYSQLLMDVLGGRCYKEPQEHVTQHSSFTHQLTRTDSQQSRGSRESIPNHHLHIPTFGTGNHGVGGGSGWNQKEDNGNTWSPTRPMSWKPGDIPESGHLSSVLPAVSGSFNAHAINGSENKYRIIEIECPSPTPRLEMKESPILPQDGGDTANKWSNVLNRPEDPTTSMPVGSLVNHGRLVPAFQATGPSSTSDAGIFLDSTNAAVDEGFRNKDLGNGMQKLDTSNSSSSEFQTNLSPTMSSADDRFSAFGNVPGQALEFSSQKSEPGKQEMVLASVPKHISVGHNLPPPQLPRLQHDQAQMPKRGHPPISQTSQEIEGSVECSLPSPTPGSNNNAGSASENHNVVNAPTVDYNNSGWAVPGNTGWGTPAYGHPNANRGWGTSLHGNADENKGWGSSAQLCADGFGAPGHWNGNSNTSWGTAVQGNTDISRGWGTPVNGNSNSHTGLGAMPLENANANSGLGLAAQGNGWGSSLGSCDGGWKSSDTSRWRGNNEGDDAKLHLRHRERDMGRCGSKFQPGGRGSRRGSPGGNGHRGVCKFYENGHCKKGRSCNYLHT